MEPDRFVDGLDGSQAPIIRSDRHDVFLDGGKLIYVGRPCDRRHADERFFLHVFPVDANDLAGGQRRHGFSNLDFDFDELSVGGDEYCFVVRTLPPYPLSRITTGQFVPGEGRVWGQTVELADR